MITGCARGTIAIGAIATEITIDGLSGQAASAVYLEKMGISKALPDALSTTMVARGTTLEVRGDANEPAGFVADLEMVRSKQAAELAKHGIDHPLFAAESARL